MCGEGPEFDSVTPADFLATEDDGKDVASSSANISRGLYVGSLIIYVVAAAAVVSSRSFVIAAAQCGTHADGRRTYGHALIVSPWGEIMTEADTDDSNAAAGANDAVIHATLDPQAVARARMAIPSLGAQTDFS